MALEQEPLSASGYESAPPSSVTPGLNASDDRPAAADERPDPGIVRPLEPSRLPPPPSGWSDAITGTDGPRYWDRVMSSERARVGRYRRPATVVLVEIDGLEFLARQWGHDVAERALVVVARTLAREIRSSDHIARIEPARFGMLLTETSEIAAINFVERARSACEVELGQTAELIKVGFGWASPPDGGDLSDAILIAASRLAAELDET